MPGYERPAASGVKETRRSGRNGAKKDRSPKKFGGGEGCQESDRSFFTATGRVHALAAFA